MRRTGIVGALILVAAVLAPLGLGVKAADLGASYAPNGTEAEPEQPLEFGTGWYLRGDLSVGPEDKPKLVVNGSTPDFNRDASALGYGVGVGAGYKFNQVVRVDVTADYLDPFEYKANIPCGTSCGINRKSTLWRWDSLVNGYVDLGTWFGGFTPYIGAGAGVSGTYLDGSVGMNGSALTSGVVDPQTGRLVTANAPGRADYRFAWAGMAGFSYAVSPHTLLDVGYRYLDLGKTNVTLYPSTSTTKGLTSQQFRLGVRYMID